MDSFVLLICESSKMVLNNDYMVDTFEYLNMPKQIRGIAPRELAGVINSFGLKRIVIIGDERYVSAEFENNLRKINTKATPIVRIYGENWLRIAEELDDLLNVGHLASNFRENYQDAIIRTQPTRLQSRPRPATPEKQPEVMTEVQPAEAEKAAEPAADVKATPVDPVPAK